MPRSRGPGKGGKDVGLSSSSRPKFKRNNSGKFKSKSRVKPAAKGKEKDAAEPAGREGEAVVTPGAKRKRQEQGGGGGGDKRFKGKVGVLVCSGRGGEAVC